MAPTLRGTGGSKARGDESGGDTGATPLHVQVAEALGSKLIAWHFPHAPVTSDSLARRGLRPDGTGAWSIDLGTVPPTLDDDTRRAVFDGASIAFDDGTRVLTVDPRDYEHDWSATGPLIEKHGIAVAPHPRTPGWWEAWQGCGDLRPPECARWGGGPHPLVAVCHLIVLLARAGKLKEA